MPTLTRMPEPLATVNKPERVTLALKSQRYELQMAGFQNEAVSSLQPNLKYERPVLVSLDSGFAQPP